MLSLSKHARRHMRQFACPAPRISYAGRICQENAMPSTTFNPEARPPISPARRVMRFFAPRTVFHVFQPLFPKGNFPCR